MVAKCLQSKDTTPISPLEAGLSLGWASGPLGAIFELLKHMGIQSSLCNSAAESPLAISYDQPTGALPRP